MKVITVTMIPIATLNFMPSAPNSAVHVYIVISLRGRSQLSTFIIKVYTVYARGEGVWDHRTLSSRKSTFIFNHWKCIIKYCTCLESGQYANIWIVGLSCIITHLKHVSWCRNVRKVAQTVAPHRGFCMAAQRRCRFCSACTDSSSQIAPNRE